MTPELRPIDCHFADFIRRESGSDSPILWAVSALLSAAAGQGHICLDLAEAAGTELFVHGEPCTLPPAEVLAGELQGSAVVGMLEESRPLVLDTAGRLYLHRYWAYERDLARAILERAAAAEPVCEAALKDELARLFPGSRIETDWQAVAALAALRKKFCIISGGPGTGKTSTVVKILALLLEQQPEKELRIALAAPTGKAAARLKESISRMREALPCAAAVREQIPAEVSTIHRLLGTISGSVRFLHSEENPLPHDVVIVDEASMIDLPLMAKLVTALKPAARLVLLGDRDQLASVEAGAVLGDLCGNGGEEAFSDAFRRQVQQLVGAALPETAVSETSPSLADTLVILRKNYRFAPESGIARLAAAVNNGDGDGALALLSSAAPDISWRHVPESRLLKQELTEDILEGYRHFLAAATAEEALQRFDAFRILCALRDGPYGVTGMTRLVEEILAERGLIDLQDRWYRGRPVLVTANDYSLRLFNGDVGIVFPDPEFSGMPRVYFQRPDGGMRTISPVRMPPHETAYAMTVHKSQGSEFERVLLVLPNHDTQLLSRELLYTGITRARREVRIWGEESVFAEAATRRIHRRSGLADRLWMA